jgi:uncharacterized protein (UPF0335 family)
MTVAGHNTQTEREMWEEQQFHNGVGQIKRLNSDMAGTKGEIGGIYKRLKDVGFTKADVKWAFELQDKDASEVIATMERRLRIARWLGHRVARQFDMFDKDRTPAEDAAYEDGLAAGKQRKPNSNPYDTGSPQGQRWQAGFNDGTEFINKELNAAVNGDDGAIPEMADDEDGKQADGDAEWNAAAPKQAAE